MTKYITGTELAERLGLSYPTVRRMMLDGEFPTGTFYLAGRTARYDGDAIEDYLLSVANKRAQIMRSSTQDQNQLELPLQHEDEPNE